MHRRSVLALGVAAVAACSSANTQEVAAAGTEGATPLTAAVASATLAPADAALLTPAARRDYLAWLALGPGGLPANVSGWLVATALRPLSRETKSVAMYPVATDPAIALALPVRAGARPGIAPWPIPHRQSDQVPAADARDAAFHLTSEIAAEAPEAMRIGTSKFERRGPAVFVNAVSARAPWLRGSRSEAGHVHPSDGSLHLVLRPSDARTVIEAGWGERHPLAGVPGFGIPSNYLMIYAPRTEEELAVVRMLFRRAAGG